MPTAPPAPVRFTTTTGCFQIFSICAASGRPTMSATPPGGNGTTIVTGFEGYAWPSAAAAKTSSAIPIGILLTGDPPFGAKLHDVTDVALYRFTSAARAREMQ